MARTEHFIRGGHEHALTGMDFGMDQTGILVLSLRKGREFEEGDIMGHVKNVRRWLQRWASKTEVSGMRPILDEAAIAIYHDRQADVIVARFRCWLGYKPEFECYAHTFASTPEPPDEAYIPIAIPPSGLVN